MGQITKNYLSIQYFEVSITNPLFQREFMNTSKNVNVNMYIDGKKARTSIKPQLVTNKFIKWKRYEAFEDYALQKDKQEYKLQFGFFFDDNDEFGGCNFLVTRNHVGLYSQMIQGNDIPCKFGQVEFEIVWKKKIQPKRSSGDLTTYNGNLLPLNPEYSPEKPKQDDSPKRRRSKKKQSSGFFSCCFSKRKKPTIEKTFKIGRVIMYEQNESEQLPTIQAQKQRLVNLVPYIVPRKKAKLLLERQT